MAKINRINPGDKHLMKIKPDPNSTRRVKKKAPWAYQPSKDSKKYQQQLMKRYKKKK